VAINRLLQGSAFAPDQNDRIAAAYEDVLRALRLTNRIDPLTEIVAKKIFEIAQTGELDTERITELALKELANPSAEGFDEGSNLSERTIELQRVATAGLSDGEALAALGNALGQEVAAMIARHPRASLEEILDVVCRGVRKQAYTAAGAASDDRRTRVSGS